MKLRNKKTRKIIETYPDRFVINSGEQIMHYNSLAELSAEWEDYEEPKEYWYIDTDGEIMFDNVEDDTVKVMREIGNYFETKEEAEKAVEKLKAWKRLKDKGFRFDGWEWKYQKVRYEFDFTVLSEDGEKEAEKDLDLLFGGEE